MASGSSIRAGRAHVELWANDKRLRRGLMAASRRMRRWATSMSAMGLRVMTAAGAVLGGFALAAKSFASTGDVLDKMSKRTGMSVEMLSALDYAAQRSGTSLSALEGGIKRMQRTVYDAGRELSTAVDALADIGVEVKDLEGLSPEEQFNKLARAVAAIEDPSKRAALSMVIFGRAGTALLPMFSDGVKGFDALLAKGKELNGWTTEDAAKAAMLTDEWDDVWLTIKRVWMEIGLSLVPTLRALGAYLLEIMKKIREWIRLNRQLIILTATITAAIFAFAAGMWMLGKVFLLVSVVIKVVTIALKAYTIAQAIAQAMSGPKGWLILAGAIAATATAIWGVNKAWEAVNAQMKEADKLFGKLPSWKDLMKDVPKVAGIEGEGGPGKMITTMRRVLREPRIAGVFSSQRLSTLVGGLKTTDKLVEHAAATAKNTKRTAEAIEKGKGETFG